MPEGAYAAVPVWRSREAWLAWVDELLQTPAGVELCRGRIKADTVLIVAREEAATADRATGRGVTTSRETLAKRLGMSGRHVGTARAILERLGASVTIVRGRELSPDERSQAYAAHGGRQSSAASVRALTMPSTSVEAATEPPGVSQGTVGVDPVDTFHLPRRGEVNLSSYLSENSPTRARARVTAAPRPKPERKSTHRVPAQPRDLETQRFVWAIAQRFLLCDSPTPRPGQPLRPGALRPGALRGGRHLGHLARILERNLVTPRRYTPQSLADALQRLIDAGKLRPPRFDEIRDPLRHFAWTLRRLNELTEGETTIERIRRESEERAAQHRQLAAQRERTDAELEEAQDAARAFFEEARRHRRPTVHGRRSDVADLVRAVIGGDQPLYATPPAVQELTGTLTRLHQYLVGQAWTFTPGSDALTWSSPAGDNITIRLARSNDLITAQAPTPLHDTQYDSRIVSYLSSL